MEGFQVQFNELRLYTFLQNIFPDFRSNIEQSRDCTEQDDVQTFGVADLKGEIGYVLSPDYRGLGLMTEAARRVIAFGFDELGLARIEARHVFGNERSAAVMRRCGMEYEGTLRKSMMIKGELKTVSVYAILKEDRARLTERKQ